MLPEVQQRPRSTLVTVVLVWVAFYASFTLFAPALLDDADSVHAEVAREMLVRHDYVTLYANGIRYLEKAPLLYWSMAASMKVFGVSTAAARVPLAVCVLLLALMVEAFARRLFGQARAGLYAALILLSSFGMFLFTRITIPDAGVCLWMAVAMYCFWRTEELEEGGEVRWWVAGFAAACAANVLTKGLIGVVFPVAVVGLTLLLTRGWRGAWRRVMALQSGLAVVVFLAIAAPWHVAAGLANPTQGHPAAFQFVGGHWVVPLPSDGNVRGWFWFYFMNEHVLRYLNLRVPHDYDTVPLVVFWGLCFVWMMPWSGFVFSAVRWGLRRRCQGLPPAERGRLLLVVWAGFVLLFFSLSTRQEYYVLPAFPAVALLVGGWLARESLREGDDGRWALRILCGLGGVCAVAMGVVLLHAKAPVAGTDLASLLRQNPGEYAMSMGHFLDLNATALGMFRLPLAVAAVSLFGGPMAAWVLRRSCRQHAAGKHAANMALAAGAFGFLLAAHLGLQVFAPVLSSAQLARAIAPQVRSGDMVAIHGEYETGSTLGFYLRRNDVHILEGRSSNLWYGSFFPDAPKIFETSESFAAKWSGPQRIFLWQSLTDPPNDLPVLAGPVYVVAKSGGKEIVSNQASSTRIP